MTVATSTAKSGPYAGSGTTGPFTVGFRFLENAHIQVIRTSSTGVDTTLALTTDYTVTGAGGASGSVTLVAALAVGQQLTIIRNVPFTQDADYVQNDAFPAESHERALDKLTMQTQQLLEAVNRAAKLPVTSTEDAQALTDDITLLADNLTTINAVAGSLGDIDTVATSIGDVNTVADNLADVTNFADVYYGPSATDPTLRNDGTALQSGDLYFNTATAVMRVYGGATWTDVGTALPVTINQQSLNGTGSQTVFTLSSAPTSTATLEVFIGGVRQVPTTVYSVSGTTLTFTAAPPAGTANIFARWVSPIAVGVPSDDTVSTAKIQDAAVILAKLGGDVLAAISNSAPAGAVIHVAMNTAPTGYLKANGALVSRTTYAALFTAIGTTFGVGDGSTTFALPDLRGEFIRGWADGRAVDTGRVFGSAQTDAFQGHFHSVSNVTPGSFGGGSGGNSSNFTVVQTGAAVTDGTNGTPRTAAETRPRNIALLACIKF
jgi:microcystin-dependent protein